MPRSLDRLQPALAPSNSQVVFRLLSSIENPSFPGEGFAGAAVRPAAGNGASRRDPAGRRIAPSIRAARRLSYRHRSLFNHPEPSAHPWAVQGGSRSQLTEMVSGKKNWAIRHRQKHAANPRASNTTHDYGMNNHYPTARH